jgi:hypothetical protein
MANLEHLEILKQGVDTWNKWRQENRDIHPDLTQTNLDFACLSGANLQGINLSKTSFELANLSGANLVGANLFRANLERANLSGAYLSGANLRDTNLRKANLEKAMMYDSNLEFTNLLSANLQKVNLERAKLSSTNLSFTNMDGADLSLSKISFVNFSVVDLSTVKGLERVYHYGSSSIDIHTLYMSKGNIPEIFLRGCGVPVQMIEYAKSLTLGPIEYYSCFISYSHNDEVIARWIHNDLQAAGVSCWFADHDMKIGDKIRPVIDDKIRIHDKLLLILSEHSVLSDWVEHEVEHALSLETERKKGMLFPVRLDEAIMDSKTGWAGNIKRQRHIGDFTRWKEHDSYQEAFNRLLRDLKAG